MSVDELIELAFIAFVGVLALACFAYGIYEAMRRNGGAE